MRRIAFIALAIGMVILVASGMLLGKGKPPKPSKDIPCDAVTIRVLNDQLCGETIWIDVLNTTAVEDILCGPCSDDPFQECDNFPIFWIGGTVVADPSREHGFYFEPASIVVANTTLEGLQTSVCLIEANPGVFDGGLWYIAFWPLEVQGL